jgi:hypothetical protein
MENQAGSFGEHRNARFLVAVGEEVASLLYGYLQLHHGCAIQKIVECG